MLSGNCEQLPRTPHTALKRNKRGQWFRSEKPKCCSLLWARWDSALCVCLCVCASVPATTKDRIVCDLYTLSFDERYYTNSRLRQRLQLRLRVFFFFCAYARHGELAHSHQTKRQTTTTATFGGNEAIAMKWKCIRVCLSQRYASAQASASVLSIPSVSLWLIQRLSLRCHGPYT